MKVKVIWSKVIERVWKSCFGSANFLVHLDFKDFAVERREDRYSRSLQCALTTYWDLKFLNVPTNIGLVDTCDF